MRPVLSKDPSVVVQIERFHIVGNANDSGGAGHSGTASFGVLGQQRHTRKGFAAGAARVLLHVRVRLQMGAQIRPVGEGAVAVRTREGLLASVRPNVALQ